MNFLSLLGWSPEGKEEVLSRAELIGQFTLERVGATPSIYSPEKLDWMNGHYIRQLSSEDLAEQLIPFYQEAGLTQCAVAPADRERIARIVPLIQERIKTLKEAPELSDFLLRRVHHLRSGAPDRQGLVAGANRRGAPRLSRHPGSGTKRRQVRRGAAGAHLPRPRHHDGRQDRSALRIAAGRHHRPPVAPPLFQTMAVLGPEVVLRRVDAAIDLLGAGVQPPAT